MKFTEEQYQKIVSAWDFEDTYVEATQAVIDVISVFVTELDEGEALALANIATRDWAHEQFVEKEKKYVWRDKYTGYVIYKMLNDWSLSATALGEKHFTETELENSPFKSEWFDKEEVE
ncbi:hypothetical protein ACQ7EN_08160 [Leuconostoc lactis]|uniref:hypothetical protein n=1 Tax=Leuconostoc lactis TaxID=1246 RepID=UPI003D6ADE01